MAPSVETADVSRQVRRLQPCASGEPGVEAWIPQQTRLTVQPQESAHAADDPFLVLSLAWKCHGG